MNQPQLIFRNTAALGCARMLERGTSALLSFFVARFLGAPALGVYSAAIVFLTIISLVAEIGSATFVTREIARDRSQTAKYVVHFGLVTLVMSGAVTGVACVVVAHLNYSAVLRSSMYVIMFATLPAVLKIIQEAVFLAHQRAEFIIYSTIPAAIFNLVASLSLLHQGYGIVSIVLVFTLTQYVTAVLYLLFLSRRVCRLSCHFDIRFAWTLLGQVKAFSGSSILGGLLARPEVMILSLFGNDAQIGFYSASLRIVDLWALIPETYMKNVLPVLSYCHNADRVKSQALVEQCIRYLSAISLTLTCVIYVAARPLVFLLYGPAFGPSVLLLRMMACCIPLAFLFELFWRVLVARNQQGLMLRAQFVIAPLRLAGGYVLVARLASTGAALAVFSFLAAHVLLLGFYTRLDGMKLHIANFTWRLPLVAVLMMSATALVIERSQLWMAGLASGLLYGVIFLLLKVVSSDNAALFQKLDQSRTAA
jgi:O-antigen/teichoic acid export membrane protein